VIGTDMRSERAPSRLETRNFIARSLLDESRAFDMPVMVEQLRFEVSEQGGYVVKVICFDRATICITVPRLGSDAQQAHSQDLRQNSHDGRRTLQGNDLCWPHKLGGNCGGAFDGVPVSFVAFDAGGIVMTSESI
jgi:hypothetical protein